MNICRSCGASIVWAITETGRRIPLDPAPQAEGNIVLTDDDPPVAHVLGAMEVIRPTVVRHRSHFASCPDVARHRRR